MVWASISFDLAFEYRSLTFFKADFGKPFTSINESIAGIWDFAAPQEDGLNVGLSNLKQIGVGDMDVDGDDDVIFNTISPAIVH